MAGGTGFARRSNLGEHETRKTSASTEKSNHGRHDRLEGGGSGGNKSEDLYWYVA